MPESKLQREEPADPSERSGIFLSQSRATWNWNRPHAVAFGSQEPNRPKRLAFRRKGTLGCKHSPLVQFGCLGFLRVMGVVVRILSQGCCTDGQCQRSVGVLSVCFASGSVVIAAGKQLLKQRGPCKGARSGVSGPHKLASVGVSLSCTDLEAQILHFAPGFISGYSLIRRAGGLLLHQEFDCCLRVASHSVPTLCRKEVGCATRPRARNHNIRDWVVVLCLEGTSKGKPPRGFSQRQTH